MSIKRRVNIEYRLNCWLFVVCLLIRGRLSGIVIAWDSILPHLMGISKRGNIVHFRRTKGKPRTCSLSFVGQPEVMRGYVLNHMRVKTTKLTWGGKYG